MIYFLVLEEDELPKGKSHILSVQLPLEWVKIGALCKWKMISDLNMSHEKISGFVSFPLFGFK